MTVTSAPKVAAWSLGNEFQVFSDSLKVGRVLEGRERIVERPGMGRQRVLEEAADDACGESQQDADEEARLLPCRPAGEPAEADKRHQQNAGEAIIAVYIIEEFIGSVASAGKPIDPMYDRNVKGGGRLRKRKGCKGQSVENNAYRR